VPGGEAVGVQPVFNDLPGLSAAAVAHAAPGRQPRAYAAIF
jgi:hypothetical protein